MSVTFEGYKRRIDKINGVLAQYGIKDQSALIKALTAMQLSKVSNLSALKMRFGHTPWVAQSQSKRIA